MTKSLRRAICLTMPLASFACSEPIELEWKHDLGAASVSTPLVTEDLIAVGTEIGLVVLERNGQRRCAFDAKGEVISAPKTDGELIFFGSTNYNFYAIKPDCSDAWKYPSRDRIKSDPLVAAGMVYVSSYDGHVYALRKKDGSEVWTFPSLNKKPAPVPPEPAEDAAKKKKRSKKKGEQPETPPVPKKPEPPADVGDFSYSSPYLDRGVLYLGNLDGRLYALDAESGEYLWHFKTDGPVTSSPAVVGETLFVGSNDGNVYALDLQSKRVRWTVTTQDWVNSSPNVVDGVVYIGSNDRTVLAIDAKSGETIWTFATAGPAIAIPAVYQDLVLAAGGSGDGALYALQRTDGKQFWKHTTGGKVHSDPVLVDDQCFLSSTDRFLYAFRIKKTAVK